MKAGSPGIIAPPIGGLLPGVAGLIDREETPCINTCYAQLKSDTSSNQLWLLSITLSDKEIVEADLLFLCDENVFCDFL